MIIVRHKIIKKFTNERVEDKYTIYKFCFFRKKIKYLFIGLNPSASNDEFTDETNLWIINWIVKNDKSGGYYLTNIYKDISPNSFSSKKMPNDKLETVLKKHKNLIICVFYGKSIVNNVTLNDKCKALLNKAFEDGKLYMTSDNGQFRHISKSSNNLKIEKVINLNIIGL